MDIYISSSMTVEQCQSHLLKRDQLALSIFVGERLRERYIQPFRTKPARNGFIMMAASCLLVESLESFYNGWKKSPISAQAFKSFFNRHDEFSVLQSYSDQFYQNIRCGILHQGETTAGWTVRRDQDKLFDQERLVVDAARFLRAIDAALSKYQEELNSNQWNSTIWRNFRRKVVAICSNAVYPIA